MASSAATCTLLGLYDSPCPSMYLSPYGNKIGGYPDFFEGCILHSPPSCRICHSPLWLLMQVYCPLEGSIYHRLLHIFCCGQTACWNQCESWVVLRSQLKDPTYCSLSNEEDESGEMKGSGRHQSHDESLAREWCDDADDWKGESDKEAECDSELSSSIKTTNPSCILADTLRAQDTVCPIVDQMNTLSLSEKEETNHSNLTAERGCREQSKVGCLYKGPYFPSGYVSVIEQPVEGDMNGEKKVVKLLQQYYKENPNAVSSMTVVNSDCNSPDSKTKGPKTSSKQKQRDRNGSDVKTSASGEGYEKGLAKHGDRVFQKFHKQMLKCPQQILRYCLRGQPLFIIDNQRPKDDQLLCKSCGAQCVFELQLMPPLVYIVHQLMKRENDRTTRQSPLLEFGTVIVYTCSESCWQDKEDIHTISIGNFKEELVLVQPDPDDA